MIRATRQLIADNVGDNVGDVCGMGSDLFESEAEVMVAAMTIGTTLTAVYGAKAIVGPVLLFCDWGSGFGSRNLLCEADQEPQRL